MSVYRLTVTMVVEADHLFQGIIRTEDALKKVPGFVADHVDWDRDDPINARDFEGAKALLAPAEEA
jgi:hypothetical protein